MPWSEHKSDVKKEKEITWKYQFLLKDYWNLY